MQSKPNHPLLLQVVRELQQGKPNRIVVIDGPAAARAELATAIAAQLNSSLQRAATTNFNVGAGRLDAILLFDEADALFGKRSSVKDSHDRYANIKAPQSIIILGVDTVDRIPPDILQRAQRVSVKGH